MVFVPLGIEVAVQKDETLLDAARRGSAPLGNSCGGIGVCGRCLVTIVEGDSNLETPTAIERRFLDSRGLNATHRLACQAVVLGSCSVTTSYW